MPTDLDTLRAYQTRLSTLIRDMQEEATKRERPGVLRIHQPKIVHWLGDAVDELDIALETLNTAVDRAEEAADRAERIADGEAKRRGRPMGYIPQSCTNG